MKRARDAEAVRLGLEVCAHLEEKPDEPLMVPIAATIREQQKAAIEKVLAHIGGVEFREGDGRSWTRGWTVHGEENEVWSDGRLSIDELLDADE